ncbi:MAG: SprB repeat-containing protein [Prolixibacteraceae bacterium]|nr:SprB repeat-containing protein [Prolixibacteraceae bacterium]
MGFLLKKGGFLAETTYVSTISKDDITCYGANDGRIEFNLLDAEENMYQYSVNGGATWQSEAYFENLQPSEYPALMQRNGNQGMPQSVLLTIVEPEMLSIDGLEIVQPLCYGDSAYFSIIPSGGNGLYFSGINDSMTSNNMEFSAYLPDGGEHTIFVSDQKGCRKEQTVDIYKPAPLLFQSPVTSWVNSYMNEAGSVKVNAEGNNLQYSIDAGFSWQSSPEFQHIEGGYYDLWVQDEKGCLKIYDQNPVRVPIIPPPIDLIVDNGDGMANLIFKGLFSCDENRLRIYSNWGTKALYDVIGYQNNFSFSGYPAGTYFYQLDFRINDEWYFIKSFVEVIRKY